MKRTGEPRSRRMPAPVTGCALALAGACFSRAASGTATKTSQKLPQLAPLRQSGESPMLFPGAFTVLYSAK